MKLSQDQIDSYNANGYLSYGKVLGDEELALLRQEYDREFKRAQEDNNFRNIAQDDGGTASEKTEAETKMFQIMNMGMRNIHYRQLLYKPELLDVVESLVGPNIMLFHDQALFKPAHHGGPVPWHQDNGYWRCRPANLLSCWITLDDVDADNGAMNVLPGSHLHPTWHEKSDDSNALLDVEVDESNAKVIDLPAGGCMFHHCQTLHHTRPNTTDRQRRAFAIHYMVPGTSRENDEVMHPSFERPILRMRV